MKRYNYDFTYEYLNVYSMDEYGTVYQLVEDAYTSAPYYYEGTGVLSLFSTWGGGGDEGSYAEDYYIVSETDSYTYGREGDFGYEYNATYDFNGDWTGGGEYTFYVYGSEATKDEFLDVLTSYGISAYEAGDANVEAGCVGYSSF